MPKETYYFPHDYTSSNNPKISAMINDYKAWGYGIYWHIIEQLHQNDDHKLQLKKYTYSAIAKQMLTDAEQVLKFINDCIQEYELFESKDGFFFSDRVVKNIEKRLEISEKRSIAGQKSVEVRRTLVKQMSTSVEQNLTKEKKGKETLFKKREFIAPSLVEVKGYFDENGYSEKSATIAFELYSGNDWKDTRGNEIKSWKAKMQNVWFKTENAKLNIRPFNQPIDHRKNADSWK